MSASSWRPMSRLSPLSAKRCPGLGPLIVTSDAIPLFYPESPPFASPARVRRPLFSDASQKRCSNTRFCEASLNRRFHFFCSGRILGGGNSASGGGGGGGAVLSSSTTRFGG